MFQFVAYNFVKMDPSRVVSTVESTLLTVVQKFGFFGSTQVLEKWYKLSLLAQSKHQSKDQSKQLV